jgi:hypothetical protein
MAKLTPQQIIEINTVIGEIGKAVTSSSEIGACDKPTLSGILTSHGIEKEATFFKCKREFSNDIVSFFVKEKGVAKSRFDRHAQTHIFVMDQQDGATTPKAPVKESAPEPKPKAESSKKEVPAKKQAAPRKAPAKKAAPAAKSKPDAKPAKKTAPSKGKAKPAAKSKKK